MTTTTADRRVDRRADATWLFGLFSGLFAVSLILHQIWWGGFEVLSPHGLVVLAAMWALLRPTAVGRFAVVLAAEAVAVALDMPFAGSHTLLVLVVCAAIGVHLGWTTVRDRRAPGPGAVFEAVAPFLGAALLLVYVTAALAKLNTGFLDPAVSCATSMSRQIAWLDPSLLDPPWPGGPSPAVVGTIALEAALPVLLALRRTRLLGLGIGVGFHVVLALAGNVPFTALTFALYVAFLPRDTARALRALVGTGSTRWGLPRPVRDVAGLALLVGVWLAAAAAARADPAGVAVGIAVGTRAVVVVMALVAAVLLVACARSRRRGLPGDDRTLRVRHPVLIAALALLLVNAASPYLGLKTDASFEMFSNLRTEPGAANHLLVPEAVRVFGGQDEQLRVVASDDPGLVARTADGTRIVRFELDRALRARPGTTAVVVAGAGGPFRVGPLAPGPTLAERVAVFRDVPPPGRARC